MATLTYNFIPDQTVYHVSLEEGVREGVVKTVNASINATTTTLKYDIKFDGVSAVETIEGETDLYATLGDAQAGSAGGGALEAYQALLTA